MSGRREIILRHVKACDNFDHTWNLLCLGRVDRLHIPVSDRGMEHLRHICISVTQIFRILSTSGHLFKCIHTFHTFTDYMFFPDSIFFCHIITSRSLLSVCITADSNYWPFQSLHSVKINLLPFDIFCTYLPVVCQIDHTLQPAPDVQRLRML